MEKKNWYQSLTFWERVRFALAMKVAEDVITRAIGAALIPFIVKENL